MRQGMLHRTRTWTVFVRLAWGCTHQVHRGYRGPDYCHLWLTLRLIGHGGIASRQGGVFHAGARQSRRVSSGRLCAPQGASAAALAAHPRLFRWPPACSAALQQRPACPDVRFSTSSAGRAACGPPDPWACNLALSTLLPFCVHLPCCGWKAYAGHQDRLATLCAWGWALCGL